MGVLIVYERHTHIIKGMYSMGGAGCKTRLQNFKNFYTEEFMKEEFINYTIYTDGDELIYEVML